MENTKLQFRTNTEYSVKLNYDSPKTGNSQYGDWFMYSVGHDGEEKVFFATKFLHDKIKHYGKGDTITIEKMEVDGGKIEWNVFPDGDTPVKRDRGESADKGVPESNEVTKPQNWDMINAKKSYDIHKQVCLKLAVGLEKEKVDFTRVAKNMDRFMAVLTNDFSRAMEHLKSASNPFESNAIWSKYSKIWEDILPPKEFALIKEYNEQDKEDVPF